MTHWPPCLPDIVPQEIFNSEALLALGAMTAVAGKRVMIVRGNGGRNKLGDTLRARGAEVHYVEVYQRRLPRVDQARLARDWQQQAMDAIVVTSGEALKNLPLLVGAPLRDRLLASCLVVVNPRLQDLAIQSGFHGPGRLAAKASDRAILKALIDS